VEICYNGVWGTVCADNGWDEVNANIVCQRLGFTNSRALPTNDSRFGAGDGLVQLNNVSCTKEHLSECVRFPSIGADHRCDYTAGVICTDKFMTSTSAEQLLTTKIDATLITYTTSNGTSTISGGSGSFTSPIIYGTISGVLVIIGVIIALAIAVTVMVVSKRKRVGQTENRYIMDK
jgi:hypothetical protein